MTANTRVSECVNKIPKTAWGGVCQTRLHWKARLSSVTFSLPDPGAAFQSADQQYVWVSEGPILGFVYVNSWGTFLASVCINRQQAASLCRKTQSIHMSNRICWVLCLQKVQSLTLFILNFPCSVSPIKHFKILTCTHSRKIKPKS